MIREETFDVSVELELFAPDDRFLDIGIGLLCFVPIEFFAAFGEKDMDVAVTFTTCTSDTLELHGDQL